MDIFVDWGSTNFRAFLVGGSGVVARKQVSGSGTLKNFAGATHQEYSAFFAEQLGDWLADHPAAAIYVCGAVGGREGWVETKYTEAPAGFGDIRKNIYKIPPEKLGAAAGRSIYVATGCAIAYPDGRHDVMRGEEVKALGAAAHLKMVKADLCIPGTHCKWVQVKAGRISAFATAMTGELYDLMRERGALAALFQDAPSDPDPDSFDRGLKLSEAGFDLLTDLWQVRAQKLHGKNPPADLQSCFSGILLGHEIRHMERFFPGKPPLVLLMDAGPKQVLYRRALAHFNWPVAAEVDSERAVCAGLQALK